MTDSLAEFFAEFQADSFVGLELDENLLENFDQPQNIRQPNAEQRISSPSVASSANFNDFTFENDQMQQYQHVAPYYCMPTPSGQVAFETNAITEPQRPWMSHSGNEFSNEQQLVPSSLMTPYDGFENPMNWNFSSGLEPEDNSSTSSASNISTPARKRRLSLEGDQKDLVDIDEQLSANLLSLTDDCIKSTLKHMSLEDLCAVGLSNKRLQKLAGETFLHNFPDIASTRVNLAVDRGHLKITPFSRDSTERTALTCFIKFVQSLEINALNEQIPMDLIKRFGEENCGHLKSITITGVQFLKIKDVSDFASILKSVDTVRIKYCSGTSKKIEEILKYCRKIKYLCLDNNMVKLISGRYPTLGFLDCTVSKEEDAFALAAFLRKNPTIEKFVCRMSSAVPLEKLLQIIKSCENVEELYFNIVCRHEIADCERIGDELKKLTGLKRLEIDIGTNVRNFNHLTSIQSLVGIHFSKMPKFFGSAPAFQSLNMSVKLLRFSYLQNYDVEFLKYFSECTPNVEEVRFESCKHVPATLLTAFCQNLKRLNKVMFMDTNFVDVGFETYYERFIPDLINENRTNLADASELVVYIDSKCFTRDFEFKSYGSADFVWIGHAQIFPNLKNPMILMEPVEKTTQELICEENKMMLQRSIHRQQMKRRRCNL